MATNPNYEVSKKIHLETDLELPDPATLDPGDLAISAESGKVWIVTLVAGSGYPAATRAWCLLCDGHNNSMGSGDDLPNEGQTLQFSGALSTTLAAAVPLADTGSTDVPEGDFFEYPALWDSETLRVGVNVVELSDGAEGADVSLEVSLNGAVVATIPLNTVGASITDVPLAVAANDTVGFRINVGTPVEDGLVRLAGTAQLIPG